MSAPRTKDGLETISAEPEDYRFTFEAHPTRVRITFDGVTVADSRQVHVMRETRLAPAFYFPRDDINWDLLQRSKHRTYCPSRAMHPTGHWWHPGGVFHPPTGCDE